MNRIILATLCFLAVAVFAQSKQNGNITVTELMNGQTVNGVLPITTLANNYHVQVYKFWIPMNATYATINFVNTNTDDCDYLHTYLRSDGLPCSSHDYSTDYVCATSYNPGNGVTSANIDMYPGYDSNDRFQWATNQYHYISIGRYGVYNTAACTYTLNVNVSSTCASNQVAIGGSSTQTCVNFTMATSGTPVQTTMDQMYKISIPDGTGSVQIVLNSTDSGNYIYAANFYGPSTTNYQYYTSSSVNVGGYYIYTLNAWTPRTGDFYVYINLDDPSNNTVTITVNQCAAGMGGYNCTFNSTALNITQLSTTGYQIVVPADTTANNFLTGGFSYLYLDLPSMQIMDNNFEFQVAANSASSGYTYIRRGGFNEDNSNYGYESSDEFDSYPSLFNFNNFDFALGGRMYIGFDCSSSTTDCVINVMSNSSNTVATTGMAAVTTQAAVTTGIRVTTGVPAVTTQAAVTTGIRVTTGIDMTTMAASDSASYVIAPFVAVIVALVALMF
jgi:hypothetical protein